MSDRRPPAVLTILGSGTALPGARRHSAAHHLQLETAGVLLDCGPGTLHGLAEHGVDWAGLTHVVVSHYHNDHVGDLAAIPFAMKQPAAPKRTTPLHLIGPRGFRDFLERLAAALGPHVLEPGFAVAVHEVDPETPYEDVVAGFEITCRKTPHTDESLAYRLSGPWGTLGYTGDTGPSEELAAFLFGCDVLVAECAFADPPATDRHLSPALVAELAAGADPCLLVLTHVYPDQTPSEAVERVAARYPGDVVAAEDGLRIALGADGPAVDPTSKPI